MTISMSSETLSRQNGPPDHQKVIQLKPVCWLTILPFMRSMTLPAMPSLAGTIPTFQGGAPSWPLIDLADCRQSGGGMLQLSLVMQHGGCKWCLCSAQPSCCWAKQRHLLQLVHMLNDLHAERLYSSAAIWCQKCTWCHTGLLQQAAPGACSAKYTGEGAGLISELNWQACKASS